MKTLITLTLSGSALVLILLALKAAFGKKLSSTVTYYAWLLVMLRFLLPLPGLIPLGGEAETVPVTPRLPVSNVSLPQNGETRAVQDRDYTAFWAALDRSEEIREPQVQQDAPKTAVSNPWKNGMFWLCVWAVGFAGFLGRYLFSYFRFSFAMKKALQAPTAADLAVYSRFSGRKPSLYRCSATKSPMMVGVMRPRILLPLEVDSPETLSNILRHELMHYRRKDTLYKWFAVIVYAAQWFNPLTYLMRREVNRACELSCDEMLLRRMDDLQRRAYGETLLNMASGAALPAGVVATSFATEKKNLKERLIQIMEFQKTKSKVLASVLAFVLLFSCALFTGPRSYAEEGAPVSAPAKTVEVSTVDELIAAIAPDTEILLAPGTYDLSEASTYGGTTGNSYCVWDQMYDGPALEIWNVSNLTIRGAGKDETTIAAVPRYASVLSFQSCKAISLTDFTAGHTQEPGYCAGDVFDFGNTKNVQINDCGMYGCGVIGLNAWNCFDFTVTGTEIYSCSYGAVCLSSCRGFLFDECVFRDHASAMETAVGYLFYADSSENVTVRNSIIRDNFAQNLLSTGYSRNVVFAGNVVENNSFLSAVFVSQHYSPVVEGCSFENNSIYTWVQGNGVFPVDAEGNRLGRPELEAMSHRTVSAEENFFPPQAENPSSVPLSADGTYHVTTVDEFLAALGSDRTITLDAPVFDLTSASDYGSPGNEFYFWRESYDGPELVITGVHDLTVDVNKEALDYSQAALHYTISATPRYANVLSFQYCDNIRLLNFTAGHTREPGECSGGVLFFQNCSMVYIGSCRLYGCGILGIDANNCSSVMVNDTEIFDCSQGGASFWQTDGITLDGCSIHDINGPALSFGQSGDKTWNGNPISGLDGQYSVAEDGSLVPFDWDVYYGNNQTQVYTEPAEVDPLVALVWARGELKRLQDLGILNRAIQFDDELEYAAYCDAREDDDTGRSIEHGFYARDYSGKYMINFRIDDTVTGDVRMANIEAAADPDEPHNDWDPIDLGNGLYYYYDNFDDIFPADLTLGSLCDKLAAYWGYTGWTLSGTKDAFYDLHTPAPDPDLLVSELPEDNYYVTVYFDGDQEGVPMYIQICHFPGRVYFGFGEGHLVG